LQAIATASGAQLVASDVAGPRLPAAVGGIQVVSRALFNPGFEGTPFMVAGTFGFVLSFLTTLLTAVSIVNERLSGTFDQLQLTPASTLEILLGKLLPLGAVFAFDVVLMVLAAGSFMGVWPHGSALLFIAVSSFYVLFSLALGLILSATSATAAEAVQKTVLLSIPTIQLSGFAFPIRSTPFPIQWLAELIPATHYIRVSRAIYLRGAGVVELLPELAILVVFGALLLALALRTLERRA
jgi:ABC-2 type transport system permease protein